MDALNSEWFPISIRMESSRPVIDWVFLGAPEFREPFYDHTVEAALGTPFGKLFRITTPMEELDRMEQSSPSGLIFHISRCGSTLVSKLLNTFPECSSLSEPSLLDSLVRLAGYYPVSTVQTWLRSLVGVLSGRQRRTILKLNPAQTANLPFWRETFPEVPWLFLYREPSEVVVANLRNPGFNQHVVAGGVDEEARLVELLRVYLAQGLRCAGAGSLFVRYETLFPAGVSRIAEHFGLQADEKTKRRIDMLLKEDAKNPGVVFRPDAAEKQKEASTRCRRLCNQVLTSLISELDRLQASGQELARESEDSKRAVGPG